MPEYEQAHDIQVWTSKVFIASRPFQRRVSVFYLVMAEEFGILAELGIARRDLNAYQVATSATERLALHRALIPSNVQYAGGEIHLYNSA